MPIYDYDCPRCGTVENVWAKISEDELKHECGSVMTRLISPTRINPDLVPYVETNMGHEPVAVQSRRHRAQLLKERGLSIR